MYFDSRKSIFDYAFYRQTLGMRNTQTNVNIPPLRQYRLNISNYSNIPLP